MTNPLLEMDGFSARFGDRTVVRELSLSVERGERVALVGESGSGKSVTALSIMRLVRQASLSGRVLFDGEDLLTKSERQMRGIRGEHPAPAVTGEFETGVLHRLHGAVETDLGDLIAPRRHRAHAMLRASLDDRDEIALLAHRRGVERQEAVVFREVAHQQSIPRAASTARMRDTACAGSVSRPAASASRKISARCTAERALSCPPTMVK